jgi:sulfopyruvate decarboxylase alpha subunit
VKTEKTWQEDLYNLIRQEGISIISYVPDGGHKHLIERSTSDSEVKAVTLTTEEEGVALAVGAHLGGAKSVLLMQSSGVGNCINMLSLVQTGRFPFLAIVTMRGEYGEGNPWQVPMGQGTVPALTAMGVRCIRADRPDEVIPAASAAMTMAFNAGVPVALLLSQQLLGAKKF